MSKNVILHVQSNGTLEYNPSVPCVIGRFTGFMSSSEFKAFLNLGLENCIKYKNADQEFLWLADTTKHSIQPKEDTEWVASDWNKRAIKNGINNVAFIFPENFFGELSIKNYMNSTKKTTIKDEIEVGMFAKEEDAINWFKLLHQHV